MPSPAPRPGRARLILAIFHLASLGLLVFMAQPAEQDIRARRTYQKSECTILSGRAIRMDTAGYPKGFRWAASGWRPQLSFQLVTNESIRHVTGYSSWPTVERSEKAANAVVEKYPVGSRQTCWYDPEDPFKAVLTFGSPWNYAMLIPPMLLAGATLVALLAAFRPERKKNKDPTLRKRRKGVS